MLSCIVGLLFLLPFVQEKIYPLYHPEPLKGAIVESIHPDLSVANWFDGSYQDSLEHYFNDHFGFRSTLVRANNQVQFSLFRRAKANSVIVAKDNYLFEENYLLATCGLDYQGAKEIEHMATSLAEAAKILLRDSIQLLTVLAPGKGTYCKEFIPERYLAFQKDSTNYESLRDALQQHGLEVLDFQEWFLEMKDTTSSPLFPRCGIHWSSWGQFIAADSLVGRIEQITRKKLPHFILDSSTVQDENVNMDYDMGEGLNLLWPVKAFPLRYPHWHISPREESDSVKVLVIADSYYWGLFNIGVSRDLFSNGRFWYYNEQVFPDSYQGQLMTRDLDYMAELRKYDVVVLLFTDANLSRFPYGFPDKVLKAVHESAVPGW